MKVAVIFGTRPEIIKLSQLIKLLKKEKSISTFLIHTNQHYSNDMDSVFLKQLKIPKPKYGLCINNCSHSVMIGRMIISIEKILIKEKPDLVLVQGDTNSVLAGALAANKLGIKIGHIEAGLRSYDRRMPEEINRILTDRISNYLFCPTQNQIKILNLEGIFEKLFITGNTIVDAVNKYSEKDTNILKKLKIKSKEYILLTLHRSENVDFKDSLKYLFGEIRKLRMKLNKKIIFPIHPRTKKMIEEFNLRVPNGVKVIEPIGYLDMLTLIKNSDCILTDSGGLQEEACILKTKCITLRQNTERPETINVGANMLMGTNLIETYFKINNMPNSWHNPFGNGDASKRIIEIIKGEYK